MKKIIVLNVFIDCMAYYTFLFCFVYNLHCQIYHSQIEFR